MSERASQINLARVYMAQARATPHRSFAFTLIEWAGAARRRAAGRELFADRSGATGTRRGPWWRTPKGIVIKYSNGGYNGVQCFSTPIAFADRVFGGKDMRGQYLWHPFVIRFERVPEFLRRCEYLGKEMPQAEILEQVMRLSHYHEKQKAAPVDDADADDDCAPALIGTENQMELFA